MEKQTSSTIIQTESKISSSNKPSTDLTSPSDRHSTTTIPPPSAPPSSSIRTQSTETSINHEASKNYDENMENDKNQYLLIIIMIIQL
ncbi:unnamed protein product [Rotaria sp. Silwood1]|nr:unnamed protein product [Rotaria sp. Silwood1]